MSNPGVATPKATILIVDDTPANIMLLTELLKADYRLKVATSGQKALETLLVGEPPELVLLDIMMPGMDGYEVCSRIKENEATRDIPIIFLSALNETMDKVKAFSVGAVDYVTKPFQPEEVRARVETHLKICNLQKELERKYIQLSDLSSLKDEFLRIASHDLKNPLMCVLGFASLVETMVKPGTQMTDETHSFVSKISGSAKLMQRIIEDFLDFRAMEDGQMKIELAPVDLQQLVSAVIEQNAASADKKTIPLSFEPSDAPCVAQVDADRIRQVIENFISNAIKFSTSGQPVTVRTAHHADGIVLEVTDSGPGLTSDDHAKLFQKYAKLSNKPTGGEKSSGLGLAICRKIVELHNGKIGARNNPDIPGCTFWFEVPASPVPAALT